MMTDDLEMMRAACEAGYLPLSEYLAAKAKHDGAKNDA